MRFLGFHATPDLMGRRIWLSWDYALDALETPGNVPDVLIRRKTRDFDFPPLAIPDPYMVHDSAGFPPVPVPGVLTVTDLPDRTDQDGDQTIRRETISVASVTGATTLEIQRRVVSVWRDATGVPIRVRTDLLDAKALTPGTPYYYSLDDGSSPGPDAIAAFRAITRPGEVYGTNRRLFDMLPEAYKGADRTLMPAAAFVAGVPEAGRSGGQLRRFVDMFGMGVDTLRNGAEGLRGLRDTGSTPPDMLRLLGRQIGWEPSPVIPVSQQRNEVETATRLFDVLGTVQSLRALVTHQTGWRSQVAELAQGVARANVAASGNIQFRADRPGGLWIGGSDAVDVFSFPAAGAVGAGLLPAVLTSGTFEPFALATGMELTLAVDGAVPVRLRFGPGDFARIGAATAAEVARVINASFDDLNARAQAGAVVLETVLTGPQARIRVETARESLLAPSNAPNGALTPVSEPDGRLRLIFSDWTMRNCADKAPGLWRGLVCKSFGFGEWRDALALPDWSDGATEAAACRSGADLWLAFASDDRLHMARGRGSAPQPATLTTRHTGPFVLIPGTQLVFRSEAGLHVLAINAADYAVVGAATAGEVSAAMNLQLAGLTAQPLADGAVRIATNTSGEGAMLRVDLSASTAARALGFGERGMTGAGRWDPVLDWSGPAPGPLTGHRAGELSAAADPAGGVALAFAAHLAGAWQIRQAHWVDRLTVATPNGIAERQAGGAWVVQTAVDGLPGNDLRAVLRDAAGTTWAATATGLGRRFAGGPWVVLSTVDGLASDDIRALALLPDGRLACGTAMGLSEIAPGGAIVTTNAGPGGLIADDIRALAASPGGALWCATSLGLSRRDRFGAWQTWTPADGLPPLPLTAVAATLTGAAVGSAGGLSRWGGTLWHSDPMIGAPGSSDIRALSFAPDGTLMTATAAGLGILASGRWGSVTPADGLPMADLRCVGFGPENRIWVGGPAGLALSSPSGTAPWQLFGGADGLPAAGVMGLQAEWSLPVILADPAGGAREPHLSVTSAGVLWLTYAERAGAVATLRDDWILRLRRFDSATATWAAAQVLTVPPMGGAADREPFALPQPGGGARLFFSTDRQGGRGLASLDVSALGLPGVVVPFAPEPQESFRPAAARNPAGGTWLFHRADTPLVQAHLGPIAPPGTPNRSSLFLPDTAAVTHQAGLRTPVLRHLSRHALRHQLGDPMAYTTERPDATGIMPGDPVPFHTRRTLAIHMRQAPFGTGITQQEIARLLQLLNRMKPINLRLVLIIAPDPVTEILYPPGADIGEAWADNAPLIEALGGVTDATGVLMPGLAVLLASDIASRSADTADPATLLRRTWFPDLL
jgi:hypothetical protein